MSFLSIFSSTIMVNEIRPRTPGPEEVVGGVDEIMRCDPKTCGKLCFGVPFFFATLVYRTLALALLITFLQMWTGVILFALFFVNVLTSLYIGDNFFRATAYGLWSLLVPAGFNTDPTAFVGYTKLPLFPVDESDSSANAASRPPTDKEAERSQIRTKYFLTMHVLSSIFILVPCIIIMYALIYVFPEFYFRLTIIPSEVLSTLLLPLLILSLGLSVLTVRPYHRIDCSGGEVPSGNIIV